MSYDIGKVTEGLENEAEQCCNQANIFIDGKKAGYTWLAPHRELKTQTCNESRLCRCSRMFNELATEIIAPIELGDITVK